MVAVYIGIGAFGLLLLVIALIAGEFLHGALAVLDNDLLSGAAVAAFVSAFGFVGALVEQATDNTGLSSVAGLAAGGLVGWGVGKSIAALMRGGDEATVRTADLIGLPGKVLEMIPSQGYGQVSVVVAGHPTKLNARSSQPVEPGTPVRVTAVLSPTAVQVERVS